MKHDAGALFQLFSSFNLRPAVLLITAKLVNKHLFPRRHPLPSPKQEINKAVIFGWLGLAAAGCGWLAAVCYEVQIGIAKRGAPNECVSCSGPSECVRLVVGLPL